MKFLYTPSLLVFILAACLFSCKEQNQSTMADLMQKDGIFYVRGTNTPFSGFVEGNESGNFENGIRTGKWTTYFPDQTIKEEGTYLDGFKEGLWKIYHQNGQLWKEGSLVKNNRQGDWYTYDKEGVLIIKGVFENDLQNGQWEYYYSDGTLRLKGKLVEGKRDGDWISYNEDGTEKEVKSWNRGKLVYLDKGLGETIEE